jgi:two-component system, OmpR family, response regulator CpxR
VEGVVFACNDSLQTKLYIQRQSRNCIRADAAVWEERGFLNMWTETSENETLVAPAASNEVLVTRILVIDDDKDLTEMLAEYLEPEGFEVVIARSGEEGLDRARADQYALIILDVMLPQINGLEVLRRLRTHSQCPVIMLTARGQEVDRVVGLEVGADDYLGKPFSARELLARMNAVMRRTQSPALRSSDAFSVGDVMLDAAARTVRCNGKLIDVTGLEFDVLKVLLEAAGKIVSREDLFERVLQRKYSVFDRSIDNHVSSLRKKLGPRIGEVERIKAVRNAGYVYAYTAHVTRGA